MIEIGKNYKLQELEKFKENDPEVQHFFYKINNKIYLKKITKPVIKKIDDFDKNTKLIYFTIATRIKELNPDQIDLYVIASGSRVNGKWRSDEEAEEICKRFNLKKPKYSDYDFISNGKYMPNLIELAKELKVRYINKIGSYNKNEEVKIPLLDS